MGVQATYARGTLPGQVSIDSDGKLVAPGDVAGQAKQVMANLRAALEGA